MSNYPHPAQGYYGGLPTSPYSPYPPNQNNNYDLPPRNAPFIPMPPPPRSSHPSNFLHRHQSLLWSLLFWIIFFLIDFFAHHFPKYPYSARKDRVGHTLVVVVYTFVFQVVWLVAVAGKTAWDLWSELRGWWGRGRGPTVGKVLGMGLGLLGCVVLVGWPATALGVNASVVAKRNRGV